MEGFHEKGTKSIQNSHGIQLKMRRAKNKQHGDNLHFRLFASLRFNWSVKGTFLSFRRLRIDNWSQGSVFNNHLQLLHCLVQFLHFEVEMGSQRNPINLVQQKQGNPNPPQHWSSLIYATMLLCHYHLKQFASDGCFNLHKPRLGGLKFSKKNPSNFASNLVCVPHELPCLLGY